MRTALITYWNQRRGFGFAGNTFVHANALCSHLYPGQGNPVKEGTEVIMVITEDAIGKGERASVAMCADCATRRRSKRAYIPTMNDVTRAMGLIREIETMTEDPHVLVRLAEIDRVLGCVLHGPSPVITEPTEEAAAE